MTERVLIIGLDGATWTVLEPFIEAGDLPNIAALREAGSWGELRSTLPPLSAPAWATFMTGKSPARHGVFHFLQQGDDVGIVDGRNVDSATVWDVLGHADKKVGVINMPMTYPPRPVNGFLVTGLLTPPGEEFTYPPELSTRLDGYQIDLDRFIDHKPFAAAEEGPRAKRQVKPDVQLMAEFHAMEERRGQAALDLMRSEPWDVFAVVFTATDRMGHYLWQYHVARDVAESAEAQELHEAIRGFYRALDGAIGDLVDAAGDETMVMIASDHGMGAMYRKHAHWNSWLYEQGHLKLETSSGRTVDGWLLRLGLSRDRLRKVAAKVPGLLESRAVAAVKEAPTAEIDEDSLVRYERIFDPVGGFRINATGANRDRIRDELMSQLLEIRDPDTGEPIVDEVMPREECFAGPYAELAPDLIIVMNGDYGSSNRLSSYSAVVTERPHVDDPGSHRMEGILVCAGPDVVAGGTVVEGAEIEDVAPTVLHALGLGIPSDMDGRVLRELFRSESVAGRTPATIEPPGRWPSEQDAAAYGRDKTVEDEEAVKERLRALGYFE